MLFLKEDTAADIKLGPFVDKTDGVTYETGLAAAMDHADTGVRLSKNGAAFADRHEGTEPSYDAFGYYLVKLDTTDTNTPGTLKVIFGAAATCLPCEANFQIVAANVYDSLFAAATTDYLDVQVKAIDANAITATAINADAITNAKIADDAIAVENIKDAAITAAKIASDAIEAAKIKDGAITNAKVADDVDVNVKTITAGIIANASFNENVGSTAYATNIIALAVRKVLDELNLDHLLKVDTTVAADGDLTSYVADGSVMSHLMTAGADTSDYLASTDSLEAAGTNGAAILTDTGTTLDAKINLIEDILRNKMEITDATGDVVLYADDSTTPYLTGNVQDISSTTTTRTRLA